MEKPPHVDAANFIDKNVINADLEVPDAELAESISRLETPFEKMTVTPEAAEINLEEGKILIGYAEFSGLPETKRIEKLVFKTEEKEINLFDVLPRGTVILVQKEPDPKEQDGYAERDRGGKNGDIFIKGELDCPKMILILLHEIGHIIDFEKLDKGETHNIDNFRNTDERADIAEKIRKERVASAFALNAIRPYVTDDVSRKDVQNFLYSALDRYCKNAQKKLEIRKKIQERERNK